MTFFTQSKFLYLLLGCLPWHTFGEPNRLRYTRPAFSASIQIYRGLSDIARLPFVLCSAAPLPVGVVLPNKPRPEVEERAGVHKCNVPVNTDHSVCRSRHVLQLDFLDVCVILRMLPYGRVVSLKGANQVKPFRLLSSKWRSFPFTCDTSVRLATLCFPGTVRRKLTATFQLCALARPND